VGKAIRLKYVKKGKDPRFELTVQGFKEGEEISLVVWEVDSHEDYRKGNGKEKIGTIKGKVVQPNMQVADQFLTETSAEKTVDKSPRVVFALGKKSGNKEYGFSPVTSVERKEGDSWEIQVLLDGDDSVRSRLWYLARYARFVPSRQATYHWYSGNRVTLYNDASTDANGSAGYFKDLEDAIGEAKHFIFIADWSFHPYVRFRPTAPKPVGQVLIDWAKSHQNADVKKKGLVAIHTWDHTNIAMADSQNDDGEKIFKKEIVKPGNMLWRKSSRTGEDGGMGFGWSHHQKFVVLDAPAEGDKKNRRTIKAFLGGLDLTQGRYDWPDHPIMPDDPACADLLKVTNRKREVHEWYNAEFGSAPLTKNKSAVDKTKVHPRQPWHDMHCQVAGPTAWDVVREFVGRWNLDPSWVGAGGDTGKKSVTPVVEHFQKVLFDKTLFVQQWEPHKGPWSGQILRSITKDHWGSKKAIKTPARSKGDNPEFNWTVANTKKERSIQDAYLRVIGQAERFVYIETQYFISSGPRWIHLKRKNVKNSLAEALVTRILQKAAAKEPFHVYLIVPMFPEGDPSGSVPQAQRDFQWNSVAYIIRSLQKDSNVSYWGNYFTVGFLANWGTVSSLKTSGKRLAKVIANRRYMIYVHSKGIIVDDSYVLIGSANLNERSLAGGRDSEIAVGLWPNLTKQKECVDVVQAYRKRLWTEHFGSLPGDWKTPEKLSCAKAIQKVGADNWELLSKGKTSAAGKNRSGHFCAWPVDGRVDGLGLRGDKDYIFDGLSGLIIGDDWYIWPTGYALKSWDLAE
jgi:phospholipase D1/2